MLSAIPAYLSIGDGGFATAACREITMRGGSGDKIGIQAVFQSTWLLLIMVSMVTGLLAFCLVETAPLQNWLGFSDMNGFQIKIVLLLLVTHMLINFQGELLNGGFWVTGRYPASMYFIAISHLLEFGGLAVTVSLGGGPIQAACGYLSGRILGTGLMWLGQRKASPWLRHGFTHASFTEIKRLAPPAFASAAFPLGNALNIQGMRLIVGLALGPSAVAVFVPLRTLSRIAMQPVSIISRLIQPELALAYGAGDNALFQSIFDRSCQLSLWGCIGVCLIVGPGAYWIFPIWTSGMVAVHWPSYLVLLGGMIINSIWYTALMVPYSINCHGSIAIYYILIYGLTASGLGYLGAIGFGLGGIALALFLAETTMAVVVIQIALPLARSDMVQWINTVLRSPLKLVGMSGVKLRHKYRTNQNNSQNKF